MTEKESDSSFSHSACQIVLEKEAENLKVLHSRLADESLYHNDKATKKANMRSNPSPPEPLNKKRGKSSGHNNPEVLSITLHQANEDSINVVTQGIPREKLYPQLQQKDATTAATTSKAMAREENGGEMDKEES